MFRHQNIWIKTAVLCTGALIALAILVSPIARTSFDATQASHVKGDKKEESPEQTQISTFEAVAQIVQLNLIPHQEMTEAIEVEHTSDGPVYEYFLIELPGKLFQVLFRTIISPNAP